MDGGVFRVAGAADVEPAGGWGSVFAVYAGAGDVPALLGTYAVEGGDLVFRPRFPLGPGMKVRAVYRGAERAFEIPRAGAPAATTRVASVYPSKDVLPENA